jgi:hypothetical protein
MVKPALAFAVAGMVIVTATTMTASAASKASRVSISYALPKNPVHQPIYEGLKQHRTLEKLQEILRSFRLPSVVKI